MMHVLGCARVREELAAYHDGELSIEEQVLIQGHLRDCIACAIEAAELEELSEGLRAMSTSLPDRTANNCARLPGAVIERLRVERQLSLGTRLRALGDDMHFAWAALGATCAMIACLGASIGVLQAASRERPDSLAGMITYLANPGSNANPVSPDARMLLPRAQLETEMPLTGEDAELTLSAVVTREGRVQNLELLVSEQAHTLRVKPEVVLAMLNAAASARFQPAQAGGSTVAVNLVWLVATTTVRGQVDYDMYLVSPPRRHAIASPVMGLTPPKVPAVGGPGVKTAPSSEMSAAG
ncbi:MAG: zf-HC2 domain-containing protein [Acidobacteria bacterium]|nr:zf-HC2 domain-containing protein [Acidobacteriota bacterium]